MFSNKSSHILKKIIVWILDKGISWILDKETFGSLINEIFGSLNTEKNFDCRKLPFLTAEKIIFKENVNV